MAGITDQSPIPHEGKIFELSPIRQEGIDEMVDNFRRITIYIEKIENVEPAFTASDIVVTVEHMDKLLGRTENVVLEEKKLVPIENAITTFYNLLEVDGINNLISAPLYFTVWQYAGELPMDFYPVRPETPEEPYAPPVSCQSILSLYEAILGTKETEPDKEVVEEQDKLKSKVSIKEKKSKGKVPSKEKSKISKTSGSDMATKKTGGKKSKENVEQKPDINDLRVCVGSTNLELLTFFTGETEFEKTLTVYQDKIHNDDEFINPVNLPRLTVKVSIDRSIFDTGSEDDQEFEDEEEVDDQQNQLEQNIEIPDIPINALHFTVESMYNLPQEFTPNMDYKIATVFPADLSVLRPVYIENGVFKNMVDFWPQYKLWPNLLHIENFSNRTDQLIDVDTSTIKNKFEVKLGGIFERVQRERVQWNALKKIWMTEESRFHFKKMLTRYRKWPIEFFVTPKPESTEQPVKKGKKGDKSDNKSDKSGSSGSSKGSKGSKKNAAPTGPLHYMGFADFTNLLFPGVTKTRVACALRTFQATELKEQTGLQFSNFVFETEPKVNEGAAKPAKKGGKDDKAGKDDKTSKVSKEKESKGAKKPPPEIVVEPEEPSQEVLSPEGELTFIILEVELTIPLTEKRGFPDLSGYLSAIIPVRPSVPKTVQSVRLAEETYRECLTYLARQINIEYQVFAKRHPKQEKDDDGNRVVKFIQFLQSDGAYQRFLATLYKPVSMLITEKYKFNDEVKNVIYYDNYISNVYVHLINDMNMHINSLISCHVPTCEVYIKENKPYAYMYRAYEALEQGYFPLAERYHLQELGKYSRNPDIWFNYAIFKLILKEQDKAFECLKETLALDKFHKYGLLLFAIMLYERKDYYLSETTFLMLTSKHPVFIEGWVCLYALYKVLHRHEGCDICTEMISKYSAYEQNRKDDYIYNLDPLSWTTEISLKKPFFQTAMILIKIQALKYADLILGLDNVTLNGPYKYYQAVILYYCEDYEHALMHLEDARMIHGPDYAVCSLIGHCYYRLNQLEDANEAYEFILWSFNRPDDMHLVHMRLAIIAASEQNFEMSRIYMLLVCWLSPTPYSWQMLATFYYTENNFKSAEACLIESNTLDNRLPDTWAYLALINIKTGNKWEAEQCYTQLTRYSTNKPELLTIVEDERQKAENEEKEKNAQQTDEQTPAN